MIGAVGWMAHRLAARIWAEATASVRLCATAALAYAMLCLGGTVLLSFGVFRLDVALGLILLAALLVWRPKRRQPARPLLLEDASSLMRRAVRLLRGWTAVGAILIGVIILARLTRGLAAPPLTWDALTYHLLKAGRWVQFGHWAKEIAPDAWGYYEYYPPNGDLLWAWAMLPTRTDLLLAPAGVGVWLTALLGAGAACRALGARRREALPAALSIATIPALVNYLTSAYVENTTVALTLLAVPFFARFHRHKRPADALVLLTALSTAAGVKVTALVTFVAAIGWVAFRLSARDRRSLSLLGLCVLACAPALYGYHRAWVDHGSPVYPLSLTVAGHTLLEGNAERELIHAARITPDLKFRPSVLAEELLLPRALDGKEHLGLGPLSPLLMLAGILGLLRILRRIDGPQPAELRGRKRRADHHADRSATSSPSAASRASRATAIAMTLVAALVLLAFFSESERALRTFFARSAGRFLAMPGSLVIAFASTLRGKPSRLLWATVLAAQVVLAVPLGWSREDLAAMFSVAPVMALAGVVGVSVVSWGTIRPGFKARRWAWAGAATVLACLLGSPVIQAARDRHRYPIYAAAAEGRAYDAHTLQPDYASSWPLWRHFDEAVGERTEPGSSSRMDSTGAGEASDRAAGKASDRAAGGSDRGGFRLAVTAGFDGVGHNWYRYPLLGSRLQNEVVYVTPIADGSVIDYRRTDDVVARADAGSWLRRLDEGGLIHVVTLAPDGLEAIWIEQLPDRFRVESVSVSGHSRAFVRLRGSR